jgi:hypothetical protein
VRTNDPRSTTARPGEIVYVEINFVLELPFVAQEEHGKYRSMLVLARTHPNVELALPVVSVGEAYEAFERRQRRSVRMPIRTCLHRESATTA